MTARALAWAETAHLPSLVLCSAIYGFAIGSVHSLEFALRNLVKFPMLLIVTALVCGLAHFIAVRSLTLRLTLATVQLRVLHVFRDVSLLLASLAPAMIFLAHTVERPDRRGLCEYPLFVGLNVLVIACCGALAVVRHVRRLIQSDGVPPARSVGIMVAWMALSLLVGAQWSWYLRPFCGVATVDAPFVLGSEPDFRGDTNFYQAVYHLVFPPEGWSHDSGR